MPTRSPEGPVRMRALAAGLPDALEAGYRSGLELARPLPSDDLRIVAVGMGGSGIAAELARGVVEAESRATISVVRSPVLPRSVDSRTEVLIASYSGNTWETLVAYDAAGRAGARRIVLTSGGALLERATADGVPVLTVPPGIPPRSAVGHLLGGVLGLLDSAFPESLEGRVARAAEATRGRIREFSRARGPAAALAQKIGDRLPFVYAEQSFVALARRWKTQIEENAKRLAVFDEVPELFHNAIVGWDALSRRAAPPFIALLLEWSGESPPVRKSFRYLERLLASKGVAVARVPLAPEDRLEALVAGIALGDHMSLFLAERERVDPYPVDAITRLKSAIGNPAESHES
ncbi:MAG TPA: SIS domain-containing protein [Thermoplasmata archaeon]|nr:SIS domain-containing protein [Thermoplasmata archaeon]